MVPVNGLLRVFWPSDAPRSKEEGIVIGWRNANLDVLVVSILQNVEVRKDGTNESVALRLTDLVSEGAECTPGRQSLQR